MGVDTNVLIPNDSRAVLLRLQGLLSILERIFERSPSYTCSRLHRTLSYIVQQHHVLMLGDLVVQTSASLTACVNAEAKPHLAHGLVISVHFRPVKFVLRTYSIERPKHICRDSVG